MKKLERKTMGGAPVYTWACPIDRRYYRRIFDYTVVACGTIAVFILAYGAFLSYRFQNWQAMGIVGGCVAVFAVITLSVCWVCDYLSPAPEEAYEMTEIYVKTGTMKSAVYFDFAETRVVIVTQKYLELRRGIKQMRVYELEEDMPFIRDYILHHVSEEADIQYQ